MLRFHPLARVEYVEAIVYLEQRREGYGERFETEVDAVLDGIRPHSPRTRLVAPEQLAISGLVLFIALFKRLELAARLRRCFAELDRVYSGVR